MEKFPLFEDRLANELVSFAIAFGLGKTWMNKIGNFNAELKLFVESLDYEWNTIYKFMDFDRYLNSIFKE